MIYSHTESKHELTWIFFCIFTFYNIQCHYSTVMLLTLDLVRFKMMTKNDDCE